MSVIENNKLPLDWPKISIVTPSYNQGKYIEDTIRSVLEQNYPNLEYIIIDGGSNDETLGIIEKYREHVAYYISEPDNGQSHAINKGFQKATGQIYTWLNSDDKLAPDALKAVAIAFMTSQADMIAGICELYAHGNLTHRHMTSCENGPLPLHQLLDLKNGWNAGQFFYQPEVFFSKKLWEKAGACVNEKYYYSMDYELWCRFALAGAQLHVIGVPLVHFRIHEEQKTSDEKAFKTELIDVRETFVKTHSITPVTNSRPNFRWTQRFKIAMLNDHGYQHGAGIAHQRIAAALSLAGHNVTNYSVISCIEKPRSSIEASIVHDILRKKPDLVIIGNIHGALPTSSKVIEQLSSKLPTYFITHDFWLFTGRCAYTMGCEKYLTGCDHACPTASEYPAIAPAEISTYWEDKQTVIHNSPNLTIVTNSSWTNTQAKAMAKNSSLRHFEQFKLGMPSHVFQKLDKKTCRTILKLPLNDFIVAIHLDHKEHPRKGSGELHELLTSFNQPDISFLHIGGMDFEFNLPNVKLFSTGYVENIFKLTVIYNAADIFVGTNKEETFGQMFMEAAMCSTPTIGYGSTGLKSAIKDGITGLTASVNHPNSLKRLLSKLYLDRKLLSRLAQTAHLYAKNEHSYEASYHSLYNIFDKQGLIDSIEAPHNISLYTNEIFFPLAKVSIEEDMITFEVPQLISNDAAFNSALHLKEVYSLMHSLPAGKYKWPLTKFYDQLSRTAPQPIEWLNTLLNKHYTQEQVSPHPKLMLNCYPESANLLEDSCILSQLSSAAIRHNIDIIFRVNDPLFPKLSVLLKAFSQLYSIPVSDNYGIINFYKPSEALLFLTCSPPEAAVASNLKDEIALTDLVNSLQ